jgi:2-phosphosulfolactate phosphatase
LILRVALTPAEVLTPESSVCLVVDVLRATSTLAAMLAAGCRDVVVEPTVERARAWSERGRLLGGEAGGLRPEGFEFGNSPGEYAARDLRGCAVAFATTNGTKALMLAARAPVVFAASLLNGPAAAARALAEARARALDVQVVCAGRDAGTAVALDDSFCAGYLVSLLLEMTDFGRVADSAIVALRLYERYREGRESVEEAALVAFADARSSRTLGRHGLAEDVRYCARAGTLDVVPRARLDGELVRVEPA